MTFLRSISAELSKLKYAPIYWLCAVVILFVNGIIFTASYMDFGSSIQLSANPWSRHLLSCLGMFGVFMFIPFLVMLISTGVFLENQSRGWKFVYATPRSRTHVFYAKLIALLIIVAIVVFALIAMNILFAYILDMLVPEMEFKYNELRWSYILPQYGHLFISVLGVIGIQYFLSLRFRGFLIPMSFGITMFIVGFIIGTSNKPFVLFSPYSYSGVVRDYHMFTIDKIGIVQGSFLNTVEIYSIVVFIVFIVLANVLEIRKNVVS